jgi:hypothetical protein
MNDRDLNNLQFLLTTTPDQLANWYDDIVARGDQDDIDYAVELICTARTELELQLLEIHDEEAEQDYSQASDYLTRFRLQ